LAKWCLEYAVDTVNYVKHNYIDDFNRMLF
jgi:hypothetical protein